MQIKAEVKSTLCKYFDNENCCLRNSCQECNIHLNIIATKISDTILTDIRNKAQGYYKYEQDYSIAKALDKIADEYERS